MDKDLARVFRLAREQIEQGEETYICNALLGLILQNQITDAAAEQALQIIRARLGKFPTVECWLVDNVPNILDWQQTVSREQVSQAVRDYRCRWLASLEQEFS